MRLKKNTVPRCFQYHLPHPTLMQMIEIFAQYDSCVQVSVTAVQQTIIIYFTELLVWYCKHLPIMSAMQQVRYIFKYLIYRIFLYCFENFALIPQMYINILCWYSTLLPIKCNKNKAFFLLQSQISNNLYLYFIDLLYEILQPIFLQCSDTSRGIHLCKYRYSICFGRTM